MRITIRTICLTLPLVLSVILGGCVAGALSPFEGQGEDRLEVIALEAFIGDIVYNISGDLVALGIAIESGADPHTYEIRMSDGVRIVRADLAFTTGEEVMALNISRARIHSWMSEGAEFVYLNDEAVDAEDYIYGRAGDHGDHEHGSRNPHVWLDPHYALRYAEIIRDKLVKHDARNADAYRANYEAYAAQLEALDAAVRATTASIPEENRVLYTYHDSWVYFARRYGYTALGAVQPNDFSEPSAQEVKEVIEQLRDGAAPAIFGTPVYPSDVLEQIGREAGISYGHLLYDESMPGEPGDPEHSYMGMMVANLKTMASALGGDPSLMDGLQAGEVMPEAAPSEVAAPRAEGERLVVVTLWAPLANLIYNVAGDKVELIFRASGTDPHAWEPTPSDVVDLGRADIYFGAALGVHGIRVSDFLEMVPEETEIAPFVPEAVAREDLIYGPAGEHGPEPKGDFPANPNVWLDPIFALQCAELARDKLVALDPANADVYRANYEAFAARIGALDAAIQATTASIPEENRTLYTYQDAFVYFARRYGYTVLGALQLPDYSEPTAQEVVAIIETLREGATPAIFGSPLYASDVLDQIGREAGVDYGYTLYDDSLPGEPGDSVHTYIGMMVENVRTMAAALGGDPTLMDGVETGNVPDSEE